MSLLGNSIMMQNNATTATLKYFLSAGGFNGTFRIYINNSLYQTMTTNTSLVTVTLNTGDTFYATITSPNGTSIDYLVNNSYVTSYIDTSPTPTVTALAGTTYEYQAYFGAI